MSGGVARSVTCHGRGVTCHGRGAKSAAVTPEASAEPSPITTPWNTASRAAFARFTVNAGELGFDGLKQMAIYLKGAPLVGVNTMSVSRLLSDNSISTTEVSLMTAFDTPSSTKIPTLF